MVSNNIMIIGSSGYIGSYLCEKLHYQYEITGVDYNMPKYHPHYKYIASDYGLLTPKELSGIDTIILLAGNSSVKSCMGDFYPVYRNNIDKFVRLLNLIKETNSNIKLIYASSASVYGKYKMGATEEDSLSLPLNNYDASKQIIDDIAFQYIDDLEIYGLRFGTVNGHSPNMRWDLMLNAMYKSSIEHKMIEITNANSWRSVLYLKDLYTAICRLLENNNSSLSGIYNLASMDYTVLDYGIIASNYLQSSLIEHLGVDDPKAYDFWIDCSKFKRTFAWKRTENAEDVLKDLHSNFNGHI